MAFWNRPPAEKPATPDQPGRPDGVQHQPAPLAEDPTIARVAPPADSAASVDDLIARQPRRSQDLLPSPDAFHRSATASTTAFPASQPGDQIRGQRGQAGQGDQVRGEHRGETGYAHPTYTPQAGGPRVHEVLNGVRRSTVLGEDRGAAFLLRQVVKLEAQEQAWANWYDPEQRTRSIVVANCAAPSGEDDNLGLDPLKYKVVQAGIFTAGGAVENLPPKHAAAVLSAATAPDNRDMRTVHHDVLSSVIDALTVTQLDAAGDPIIDPRTNEPAIFRPNLQQISDAVGVWSWARENKPATDGAPAQEYPEHPASLTEQWMIDRVRNAANTNRIEASKVQVDLLRARLLHDVLGAPEDDWTATMPGQGQVGLFPALESGQRPEARPMEGPAVQITELSVGPYTYGVQDEAEVRALGTSLVALVSGSNSGSIEGGLYVKNADRLLTMAPDLLAQLDQACTVKGVPLHLGFAKPVKEMGQYVRGAVSLVGPFEYGALEVYRTTLPNMPFWDVTSRAKNVGASDGTGLGDNLSEGYDTEKVKPNSGVGSNRSASTQLSYGDAETLQRTVRQPYAHELGRSIAAWHVAVWWPDGTFAGVYDLNSDGVKVSDRLEGMQTGASLEVGDQIKAIEAKQAELRNSTGQGGTAVGTLPTPIPLPAPRVGPRSGATASLAPSAQLQDLAMRRGQGGTIDVRLLREAGIDEWYRQEGGRLAPSQYRQAWINWVVARGRSESMAIRAWNQRTS